MVAEGLLRYGAAGAHGLQNPSLKLVLEIEELSLVAVELHRPHDGAGPRVGQARRDPDVIAQTLEAPDDDPARSRAPTGLERQPIGVAGPHERGPGPCRRRRERLDHPEPALRHAGRDCVRDAGPYPVVRRNLTDVGERDDRHAGGERHASRAASLRRLRGRPARRHSREHQAGGGCCYPAAARAGLAG